ncbi:hypothetical protein A3F66_06765 [candidate division TM6 bacterium RIFCSPHIGHO2_12_FULL_32_22]|nr:MAG: hypothetical protein A3F66_06765 [candidate division TM6 bacterium RIFCSPHIGHO2_12_FULL_32_22]
MNKKIIFSLLLLISKSAFADTETLLNNLNELDDKAVEMMTDFKQGLSREEKINTLLELVNKILKMIDGATNQEADEIRAIFVAISRESLEPETDEKLDKLLILLIVTNRMIYEALNMRTTV